MTLTSVSEEDLGEELAVIWEVEPGRAAASTDAAAEFARCPGELGGELGPVGRADLGHREGGRNGPHRAPRVQDVDGLDQLICATEDAYQQLLAEHVDYAERVVADHIASRRRDGAA